MSATPRQGNVFGIEVDNDIPGRYESFVNPEEKLKAIRAVAAKAHQAGNYAFVYIAGTECITANGDKTPHTMAKEHPDWLQRKITGEPAIFGGGTAFWIRKGDEDVWVSPYATEWRKIYMERVRQIAGTGIDGIYVDIPYWMTHFDGWENTWASFDDYTVAEFKKQTGLDARKDLKLGDFNDANFRKWTDFRIQTFTDFMHDIDVNAKSVNPQIKTIPEIYPGIEQEAVRVGADVYSLYPVVDVIAHEYEFGSGNHMASSTKSAGLVRLPGGNAFIPRFCPRQGHLDPELLLGWRQESRQARIHDEPRHVADHGGREFLGRPRTFDGRVERPAHPEEDLYLDSRRTRKLSICRELRFIRLESTSLPRRETTTPTNSFVPIVAS